MLENYLVETIFFVMLWSAVPLTCCAVAGTCAAILQAVFQIQEQSLVYLAKVVTLIGLIAALGGSFGRELGLLLVEGFKAARVVSAV